MGSGKEESLSPALSPPIFYQIHPGDPAGRTTVSLSLSIRSVPSVNSVGL
jgi:hypothetical protein